MNQLPMIRRDLENMKYPIVTALGRHSHEIERHGEEQLQAVVDSFDFEAVVRGKAEAAIGEAIRLSIDAYFKYGEGHKAIDQAIQAAISDIVSGAVPQGAV